MSFLTSVLNFIYQISQFFMPIFIFILVFNSGMSEHPKTILSTLKKDWSFFLRLVIYTNLFVPVAVWFILQFLPLDPVYANALIILFLTAGASTIIAFVQLTGEQIRHAVAAMLLLLFVTIVVVPILLPMLVVGAEISPVDLVSNLFTSIIIPLALGITVRLVSEDFSDKIRPYVQQFQKIAMNIAIYGMILGLLPDLVNLVGSGFILTGLIFLALAYFGGYLLESKNDDRAQQLTASFAGGQRNGAVAFSIAISNFSNTDLILAVGIIAAMGSLIFTQVAKYIGNKQS